MSARRPRKKRTPSTVTPSAPAFVDIVDPVVRQKAMMKRVQQPFLTLDDVVLTTRKVAEEGMRRGDEFTVTGQELAELLSYAANQGSVRAAVDAGDVSLRLSGLAELIRGHETGECHLDNNAAYFISNALEELAARLDASDNTDSFRVGLLEPRSETKVAS